MAMGAAADTISNVVRECATHKAFCAKWGVSEAELESSVESPATTAYGAYLIDTGVQGALHQPSCVIIWFANGLVQAIILAW